MNEMPKSKLRGGGGGGHKGADDQKQSCHSETSYPIMPKLGDFQFVSLRHARGGMGGILLLLFSDWDVQKIRVKKNNSGHKNSFF